MGIDEMKLNLSSKFVKGIITKVIAKAVYKKFGYKVDVQLNNIQIEVINGKAHLHVDADAEIDNNELMKIVKSIGLD